MKLELLSLHVVNCGPLRDVRINFANEEGSARPATLIAGANGSGKTTVLELIAALASMLAEDFDWTNTILARCQFAQMDMQLDGRPFSLFWGEFSQENIKVQNAYGIHPMKGGRQPLPSAYVERGDVTRYIRELIRPYNGGMAIDNTLFGLANSLFFVPAIIYFTYSRFLSNTQGDQLFQEQTLYRWVYKYVGETLYQGSLNSYLVWLEYAEPESFARVQEFFIELFPASKGLEIDRRRLRAVVITNEGRHDLHLLSSGEQNLLILLFDLRRRLTPGSIVLIDEIENSLHPAFQNRLAQGLLALQREVPFQLIVTSHAEDIYRVFGAESTLVLPMPKRTPEPRQDVAVAA